MIYSSSVTMICYQVMATSSTSAYNNPPIFKMIYSRNKLYQIGTWVQQLTSFSKVDILVIIKVMVENILKVWTYKTDWECLAELQSKIK